MQALLNLYWTIFSFLVTFVASYRVEERDILQEVVDKAFACKTCLTDILEFEFSYLDKDLRVISNKLTVALKVLIFNPCVIYSCFS